MMFMLVQVLIINLQMHLFYIIFTENKPSNRMVYFFTKQLYATAMCVSISLYFRTYTFIMLRIVMFFC